MGATPDVGRCDACGAAVASSLLVVLGGRSVCARCKMGVAREMAGVQKGGTLRYAGFWIRFGAWIVDSIIMYVVNLIINLVVMGTAFAATQTPGSVARAFGTLMLVLMIELGLSFGYHIFFLAKFGATPGKMMAKLRVVQPDGSPITVGQAFGRPFAYIISALIMYIGFIMAGFDAEKRALHDRMCGTRVIYK